MCVPGLGRPQRQIRCQTWPRHRPSCLSCGDLGLPACLPEHWQMRCGWPTVLWAPVRHNYTEGSRARHSAAAPIGRWQAAVMQAATAVHMAWHTNSQAAVIDTHFHRSTCLCNLVHLLWSRHRHEAGTAEAAHEPEGGVRVIDGRRQLLLGHPLVLRHPRLLRLQQGGQPVCDALRCNASQCNRLMSSCSWSTVSPGPASAESATIASHAAHALG